MVVMYVGVWVFQMVVVCVSDGGDVCRCVGGAYGGVCRCVGGGYGGVCFG